MALYFCVTVNGVQHCSKVPLLARQIWPWEEPEFDEAENWVINDQLSEQVIQDIAVLATIDQAARQLSVGKRDVMKRAVDDMLALLDLPDGYGFERR